MLRPAENKTTMVTKQGLKPQQRKAEKVLKLDEVKGKKAPSVTAVDSKLSQAVPSILRLNLSLSVSCSSDASTDSCQSRASTGRIRRGGLLTAATRIRRTQSSPKSEKMKRDTESESGSIVSADGLPAKKRCAWVTPNTDSSYVAFHDEEWGVPTHNDKKLFELLSFSTALAELTWPAILTKRNLFREVFFEFDPIAVSKLNEKKLLTPGSAASSLLSEVKLRTVIENARQMCKIVDEFGSFDKYIWGFVNHKPIVSNFRYPRQVPIKTSKADAISKDLVKRGFRGIGPTVVYSFMQVAGITNDHFISCFRFQECIAPIDADKVKDKHDDSTELGLARVICEFNLSEE